MINIDYSRDSLFDELGLIRLRDSYMREDEASPQDRLAFVSEQFSSNPEHAQRLYGYSSKHWLSYASPILSFGKRAGSLPISCYLTYLDDTSEGLVDTLSEVNWLSMKGGGVGIHVGIRNSDDKSVGVMPHLKVYDSSCLAYKQGSSRRGSYAAYLDISHPDIMQFLEMRKPTGDPNMRTLNLNHGINIPDRFMQIIENCMTDPNADDSWELRQPNTGEVKEVVSAKELWAAIVECRMNTGEPYLWFIDTANAGVPEFQKASGLTNNGSNLCVAPETKILTDKGYFEISSLVDTKVNVWNGSKFSEVDIVKTGVDQSVITVQLDNGMKLDCTPYHKFYVDNKIETRASDLKTGDKLVVVNSPDLAQVVSVTDTGRICDTYCFDEPLRHRGVFNGILTGNCSEISLVTSTERTAVCCLSSLNAEYYDEWKHDTQFVPDVLEMLDNVLEYFIQNAPDVMSKAKFSAYRERSVGVGVLGFHAYLQSKGIPFESAIAKSVNLGMFRTICTQLDTKNASLAAERGACPDAAECRVQVRCSHVMAVAPNASSSIIMGNTSPSIEPYAANIYKQDTLSGSHINKNKFLDAILREKAEREEEDWYDETWSSIISNNGSVQHLDCLDGYTKLVFKTAREIDQRWIVEHAADRQQFIDQAQSVNLFFKPTVQIQYLHNVHFRAWKAGLKSLYYCRSSKIRQVDQVGQSVARVRIEEEVKDNEAGCLACEG